MTAGLAITSLKKSFGNRTVIDDLQLQCSARAVHCIIGPNASGKSTLLNLIGGQLRADGGSIAVGGRDITQRRPWDRRRAGVSRAFQVPRLMETLTVREHLLIAARAGGASAGRVLRREDDGSYEYPRSWRALGLDAFGHLPAGALSHAQRKLLDIGMAIVGEPALLLCDEPTAGLDDRFLDLLKAVLLDCARTTAVLIVEHNLSFIAALQCPVSFLYGGRIVLTGTLDEVRAAPLIRRVYLHAD